MKNAVKTFVFYISVYIVSSRRIRQQENCFFILKFIIENFSETVSKKKMLPNRLFEFLNQWVEAFMALWLWFRQE